MKVLDLLIDIEPIFSPDFSSEDFGRYAKMALRLEPESPHKLIRKEV